MGSSTRSVHVLPCSGQPYISVATKMRCLLVGYGHRQQRRCGANIMARSSSACTDFLN